MSVPLLVIPNENEFLYSGETLRYKFFYKPNDLPQDWTGYTAWAQFRKLPLPAGIDAIDLSTDNGGIIFTSEDGGVELFKNAIAMAAVLPGIYKSELFVKAPNADVDVICTLQIEIKPAKTVVPT